MTHDSASAVTGARTPRADVTESSPPGGRRLLRRGRLLGLDVAASPARSQLDAGVEALDGGLEVFLDVADVHGDLVQPGVAAIAEPDERFGLPGRALDLDDETPGVGRAMRRVRREGRHEHE